jgi:uncharacterized repeat protein (TIGR01451 family)
MSWSNYTYASTGMNARISSRCQPANAPFTLQPTTPFTIRLGYDPNTGVYEDTPLETKTFEPQKPVSQFHDSLGYYPGYWFLPPGSAVFWQREASAVVPAKGNYSTKITNADQTPATDLYGMPFNGSVLGTGDPRDDGVQYGVNIAVLDKARDGSWGKIAVWNATTLVSLEKKVNLAKARPGQRLMYQLKVRNMSPAPQPFTVKDPIPTNTTYVKPHDWGFDWGSWWGHDKKGDYYNAATNSIEWKGTIGPNKTARIEFWVAVNADAPSGTVITNEAELFDDASGSSASATTVVK